MEDGCEMSLKTQPSPISLQLKLCVVSDDMEVFGSICSRDVDMSGDDGLCVCMKAHCICSCSVMVWMKSERSDV